MFFFTVYNSFYNLSFVLVNNHKQVITLSQGHYHACTFHENNYKIELSNLTVPPYSTLGRNVKNLIKFCPIHCEGQQRINTSLPITTQIWSTLYHTIWTLNDPERETF